MWKPELGRSLRRGLRLWPGSVRGQSCRGRIAKSAPHSLESSSLGVEHNDTLVAVAISDIDLFCNGVDEDVRRLAHVLRVEISFTLSAVTNLHDELPGHCEFQNHVVADPGRRLSRPARAPTDPDKIIRIDENAVLASRPNGAR